MTWKQVALGSLVFLMVTAAGILSEFYLDRSFAKTEIARNPASLPTESTAMPISPGACVDADGSWKNWPWSNVPMLSPPCKDKR